MDPNSGRLFGTFDEAVAAGVHHPLEIFGPKEDVLRVSQAVAQKHAHELKVEKYHKKKARKRAAKSRKMNR